MARRALRMPRGRGPLAAVAALLVTLVTAFGTGALSLPQLGGDGGGVERLSERQASYTEWDDDEYPDYYRVVGTAVVDVELGRTGRAVANITPEMAEEGSEREREEMGWIHPSGWGHNEQVYIEMPDGNTYHGALFNRSHLIAKSLGGEEVPENMVTGTRTQNVGDNRGQDGGMAYTEGISREWLRDNPDGTLYYSATPVYEGDELVPRSVIVDVRSSDGEIDLEVEVFNAALGFDIDYVTGEFVEL